MWIEYPLNAVNFFSIPPKLTLDYVSGTSESTNEEDKVDTVHTVPTVTWDLNVTEVQNDDICLNDKWHRFSLMPGMIYSRQQMVLFMELFFFTKHDLDLLCFNGLSFRYFV